MKEESSQNIHIEQKTSDTTNDIKKETTEDKSKESASPKISTVSSPTPAVGQQTTETNNGR